MNPRLPAPRRALALALALATAIAPLAAAQAQPQAYPAHPLRLIVPLAAGSTADIISRIIGTDLAQALAQPVVVDNKPGAGGCIAMAELARAAPDGYTIGLGTQGTLVFNLALYAKPGYDSLKDFAPIVLLGGVANVMIVPPGSAARSVGDVIAMARARPGAMTFSSGGSGTSHHLSGVLFSQLTGTKLLHVPYKGAPQGILAVMSGEVDMGFYNMPTVISQIGDGKVRALAVTSLTRSALLPQVPTLDASGVKGYEVNTWFGLVAPAGTPAAVITRLHDEVGKIIAAPAVRDKLAAQGFDMAAPQPPASFAALIRADLLKWPPLVKGSGAKVD
jgi:tripartite-type tricarboxylate transporter receptor subunit TctC